jgi:hypothetical protein
VAVARDGVRQPAQFEHRRVEQADAFLLRQRFAGQQAVAGGLDERIAGRSSETWLKTKVLSAAGPGGRGRRV